MHICQLIDEEIQKISEIQIDPENLDPRKYDELIDRMSKEIEKLTFLTKILNLKPESLSIIDEYCNKNDTHTNLTKLKDVFADSVENITDKTIFYYGDLSFKDYQRLNPNSTKLPDSLKAIFGDLNAQRSAITSLDLDFIQGVASFEHCDSLLEINIKYVGENCFIVKSFVFGVNPYPMSINVNKVGKSIFIQDMTRPLEVNIGDVQEVLTVFDNDNLTRLSFGNVSNDATVKNNRSLTSLTMGV